MEFASRPFKIAIWTLVILLIIHIGEKIAFVNSLINVLSTILLVIVFAFIFYLILMPIIRWLEDQKIPRKIGILIIYIGSALTMFLIVRLLGPALEAQWENLMTQFPQLIEESKKVMTNLINHSSLNLYAENIFSVFGKIGLGFSTYFTAFSNILLGTILLPIFLFYMLKDGDRAFEYMLNFFSNDIKEEANLILKEMIRDLTLFIQGQIIVSLSVGILVYVAFLIINIDYPLILAIIAIFTNFIPSVGPIIGTIPALLVGLATSPIMALKVLVVIIVIQQIESLFISPQVMANRLSLHPLVIICLLLISGYLAGILGLILAVPTYVVLKVVIKHLLSLYKLRIPGQ